MKGKFIIFLYILLAGGIVIWAYPIVKERYFGHQEEQAESVPGNDLPKDIQPDVDGEIADDEIIDNDFGIEADYDAGEKSEEFLEITMEDCENNCSEFSEENDLEYCRETCGLVPVSETGNEEECNNLSGLKKDYCLLDLAVTESNFEICKRIEDSNIEKTCKNRIIEDIFNGKITP